MTVHLTASSLLNACSVHYGLTGYTSRPLTGGISEHTYLLERPGARTYVARVEVSEGNSMPIQEATLLYLEAQRYPAPRVLRALDGSSVVDHQGGSVVITTFVEGDLVETSANDPAALYRMGEAMGRLHSLPVPATPLPTAEFMPRTMLPWAQDKLAAIEEQIPAARRHRFVELRKSLAATPDLGVLPQCVVHNDCHPGNAVRGADGTVTLIDWDGAGLGASVIDLGFLLIAADTHTSDVPCEGTSDQRVHAIVDGYARYRIPTEVELDHLAAAIRYRVALINALSFAYMVAERSAEGPDSMWWNGAEVAESLATRVRHRFAEHVNTSCS